MAKSSYTGPIWVPGTPVPKGSLHCVTPHVGGRRSVLKSDERLETWENALAQTIAYRSGVLRRDPLQGPVELLVDFEVKRPARPKYPDAPIGHGKGDLDKLVRAVGDALTGARVFTDDALITRIVAEKVYSPTGSEGARVELRPYTPPPTSPRGPMPIRIQYGRHSSLVGSIGDIGGLPNLLRQVADQIERQGHASQ